MKKLGLKIILFSLAFIMISLCEIPFVSAADPTCTDTYKTLSQLASETGSTTVITELTEPLSPFKQTIDSTDPSGENIDVSAVYWKFDCTVTDGTDSSTETRYVQATSACPSGATCTLVQLIRGTSGTGILKTYIAIIYRWAAGIVGIIAVLVIVISGIQISMDQGGGESVGKAKTRIMQSLSGLVVLFLSALILYTINPTFFTK